ncbi:MAG: histidine phosphatase family protein [Bifidobacteriaceae bacterium]|nr:histidine phosphatase family protein [Bifidobacteriaceae bacterium]
MGNSLKKIAKKASAYDYILLIMRHAKTEPSNDRGDFQRELTEKGLKQAKIVAKGLIAMDLVPDSISCSGAVRTQQTLKKMLKRFGDKPDVVTRQSLYEEGMGAVIDEIAQVKDSHHIAMIIGHEPTLSISSQWLANQDSDSDVLDSLNLGLSNGTVVLFGSQKPFSQWQTHDAELLAVLTPKDFEHDL